jgi:glyoxylase-like metal-dependent hydrolase (beta-lactamase superfamily II)
MTPAVSDLYFKQIPLGPMANFIYLVGSREKGECLVVDPAWDTDAILEEAARDGMRVTGSLVTHYHPDHVGGGWLGFDVPGGVAELQAKAGGKIHVNKHEAEGMKLVTGVSDADLAIHDAGDVVTIGGVDITLIHTPGHTPGSQCFLVRDRLVAGDTLFVNGCGRVDLPGSDPEAMYYTLTQTLAKLSDDVVLFPGHDYGPEPSDTMCAQKQTNYYLRLGSLDDWLTLR